ncbi:YqzL family protein [Caldicoprobacter faecalis]|uniref:YqzL-like protein n=1 Tax=Caldicoprobacter faecalis TaxID=937334 RepID=A0A1I5XXE9_9FIRM|nr:YqzL family protein [Caldicoprobacter faecalis]SFQ36586.1 YqzL-like protein [Caldicoprobacter faecalis]
MVDLLWRLFEKTGSVGSYLLYKAVQRVEGESYLDPSVSSSGEEKKVYQVGKE